MNPRVRAICDQPSIKLSSRAYGEITMQKRKRIGSYPQYLAYIARNETLEWGELLLYGAAIFLGFSTICFVFAVPFFLLGTKSWQAASSCLLSIPIFGFGAWSLFKAGLRMGKKREAMEQIEPPTRQNIAQLTAEETLVRASEEPAEGQEKVLLRAAHSSSEIGQEELLRASQKS
jgi:hypothetical protein